MRRFVLLAVAFWLLLGTQARAAALFSPSMHWRTIVTPHFRVNYPAGYHAIAQRAAEFAEQAHAKLAAYMHSEPSQRTELTLLDNEDAVNGLSLPYPNNAVYIYLSAPDEDDIEFSQYDDWLKTVITHEYTHTLHFETLGGITAAADKIFGRLFFPNLIPGEPFFLVEGIAVTDETRFTTGGRGRGDGFGMILRTAALAGHLLNIDQAGSYDLYRWPGGSVVYIYGTYFYKYVLRHYGPDKPPKIFHAYAAEPWLGINSAFKKVLGRDCYQVWDEFIADIKRRSELEKRQIMQHPLTAYSMVTDTGRYHRHPAYLPDGRLIYAEVTGNSTPHVVALGPGAKKTRLFTKSPFGIMTPSPDGKYLYLDGQADDDSYHSFNDLFRYDFAQHRIVRLTRDKRMNSPAIAPDGKRIMAVVNRGYTNDLAILDTGGSILSFLTHNTRRVQYSGLTWSPDGKWVAASVWKDGWRDIALINPSTGALTWLTRDDAADYDPAWSPDGKWLVFASDRTGVFDLHAIRMSDRKLFQVTNVLTGALEPAFSPDGKTLAFTVYDWKGYDIATMSFDPAEFRPDSSVIYRANDAGGAFTLETNASASTALPEAKVGEFIPEQTQVATDVEPPILPEFATHSYNPWPSLRPKAWVPNPFLFDEKGGGLGVSMAGSDVLLQHTFSATVGLGGSLRPQYAISYTNDVWAPTIGLSVSDLPTEYALSTNVGSITTWRRQIGQAVSVTYPGIPNALLGNLFVTGDYLTAGLSHLQTLDLGSFDSSGNPISLAGSSGSSAAAPSVAAALTNPPGVPHLGDTTELDLRYQHANDYAYGYSVSPERGSLLAVDYVKSSPLWGSIVSYDHLDVDYRTFIKAPFPHQVLALRWTAGLNLGDPTGGFELGGFQSSYPVNIVDARAIGPFNQVPLRGYGLEGGDRMFALNSEYRFPLGEIQRGVGTLPILFSRWYGVVGYDIGNIWTGPYPANNLRQSVSLEARLQLVVMNVPLELRVGLAQGTGPLGPVSMIPGSQRPTASWVLGTNLMPPPDLYWDVGTFF